MKCISLWNPWAFLMAIGAKKNETRSWATSYRGPLLIHAAEKWNKDLANTCRQKPFCSVLATEKTNQPGRFYFSDSLTDILSFGSIIAVVDLCNCIKINSSNRPTGNELLFGDYICGRYMWQTQNLRRIKPVRYRGEQRLFEIPDDTIHLSGGGVSHTV